VKVITAPDKNWPPQGLERPWVFMAGGITDCPNWQDTIIAKTGTVKKGVLFNPRHDTFPIKDPTAAKEQITWEFNALMSCHIFTMWFCSGKSEQPICMYELGRYLARFQLGRVPRIVIGCAEGYKHQLDVLMQVKLVDSNLHVYRSFEGFTSAVKEAIDQYYVNGAKARGDRAGLLHTVPAR
jgi:hypothetical protein